MEKKQEEILATRIKNLFKSDRFVLLKYDADLESVIVKETEILRPSVKFGSTPCGNQDGKITIFPSSGCTFTVC